MDRVPQELIDDILENLPEHDTLRQTSLVCRSWVPTSQRQLFRRIIIVEREPKADKYVPTSLKLCHVLLASPHLADYIRFMDVQTTTLTVDEALPLVFRKLNKLEGLVVDLKRTPWVDIKQDFKQAFHCVLQLPSLRSASISEGTFDNHQELISSLYHAQNVTRLSLSHIHFNYLQQFLVHMETQEDRNLIPYNQRSLLHLELDVDHFTRLIQLFLGPRSPFNLSQIHTLYLFNLKRDGIALNELLRTVGGSLKDFKFSMPSYNQGLFSHDINMEFNPNLQFLHVSFSYNSNMTGQLLAWLLQLLSTIPGSNQLEKIQIDAYSTRELEAIHFAAWRRIDSLLAGAQFKFLKDVEANIFQFTPLRLLPQDSIVVFPLLAERGIFSNQLF